MTTNLHDKAQRIAKENNFALDRFLYEADYYTKDKPRNVIYDGVFEGQKAILKVYQDPRITDEPVSLAAFNKSNTSEILKAPQVYAHKIETPHQGWMIVEKLPESGRFFSSPLTEKDREEFLKIFLELKNNFPQKPTRQLRLAEHLPPADFNIGRINRWFELAHNKEAESIHKALEPSELIPRYTKALEIIREEFKHRDKEWIHGHFKPAELYKVSDTEYYLLDFAHTHLFPEGHELGFMIWADCLMNGADYSLSYQDWEQKVLDWVEILAPIAKTLKYKNYQQLIRASLIERILGTILADIGATDMAIKDKKDQLDYLYRLLDRFITPPNKYPS